MEVAHKVVTRFCYVCDTPLADDAETCAQCAAPYSLVTEPDDTPVFDLRPASLWDYRMLLPIADADAEVELGAGATPLIHAPTLAREHGFGELTLKLESANPSGSFKDRQVAVGIARARELGHDTVAVMSSGNVACAAAAYAARAGMRAVVLMHGHAAPNKVRQAAAYGARAIRVQSKSARNVMQLCADACDRFGWYHLSTSGLHNPYNVEGAKTIAYELFAHFGDGLPDWIVAPVGGGGLLGGVWRGFLDLQNLGAIEAPPRLAAVQPAGCAPFVQAIAEDRDYQRAMDTPWPNPATVAGGLADDIPFDAHTALPAVRSTDGIAVAVSEEAILEGMTALAAKEGILCEPSCAVVVPALAQLPDVNPETRVCCLVTGTGIKDLDALSGRIAEPETIECDIDALRLA